jgi:myo-inositol-1(or 4)-monophosphatase
MSRRAAAVSLSERRRWLEVAVAAAVDAQSLLTRTGSRRQTAAIGREIKIAADARLDRRLVALLSRSSDWPIVSEESVRSAPSGSGYRWIIDPLDGTVNFMRGVPFSAISIALWKGSTPVLGVIRDVVRGEMFTGIVGAGAWLNGRRMRPSVVTQSSAAVLCTGFPVSTNMSTASIRRVIVGAQRFNKVRLFGSAALSLAYVACGRVDAYRERDIKIWDIAAGAALVRAAGGTVQLVTGSDGVMCHVTATNGVLRDVREALQ